MAWIMAVLIPGGIASSVRMLLRWLGPESQQRTRSMDAHLDEATMRLRDGASGWLPRR